MASLRTAPLSLGAAGLLALGVLSCPLTAHAEPPRAEVVAPPPPDDDPPPKKPSRKLALAGGIFFGTSYAISALAASLSMRPPDGHLPELYAPLVGPWIAIPNVIEMQKRRRGDPMASFADTLAPVGLGVLGIAQGLGALCLTGYLVEVATQPPRHAVSGVRVTPYVTGTSVGLAGSF